MEFIDFLSRVFETSDNSFLWRDIVQYIAPDIPKNTTFSDEVQEWAAGKKWALSAAAVLPSVPQDSFLVRNEYLWWNNGYYDLQEYLSYTTSQKSDVHYNRERHIPVMFSHLLGSPEGTSAPGPFAAPLLNDFQLEYSGLYWCDFCWFWPETPQATYSNKLTPTLFNNISFADTPIFGPLAASSAAAGYGTSTFPSIRLLADFNADTSVKFSPVLGGADAFDIPESIIDDLLNGDELMMDKVNQIAEIGMYTLYDGGYGDNNGIGSAIVLGATELFLIEKGSADQWARYFRNAPIRPFPLVPQLYFQIFDEEYSFAMEEINKFSSFSIPEGNDFVSSITYGAVQATTIESEQFGFEQGISVTIHTINIDSGLFIFGESWEEYGELVQEIVRILTSPENESILSNVLDAFVGKAEM